MTPAARGNVPAISLLVLGACGFAVVCALATLRVATAYPSTAPLLVVTAGAAILVVRWPGWLLPAFVAVTWMSVDASLLGGLPNPVKWGALVLAGAGGIRASRHREIVALPVAIVMLLGLPVVISWLAAPDRSALTIGTPIQDLSFVLIGAWCATGVASVDRVLTALAAVGIVLGVGAIMSIAVGPSALFPVVSEGAGHVRAAGPFGEPNFFALSLAAIVPAALTQIGRSELRTALGLASGIALLGGILATGSRGALLATAIGMLVLAATGPRHHRWVGVALVVAVVVATPIFRSQVGGAEARTVSGRANENLIAVAMAADHPIVGVGPGAFPSLYRDYARTIGSDPRSNREAHSLPLQIAAEQGIVGLLCAAAVIALVAGRVRRLWRVPVVRTLGVCLLVYGVGSLFLHGSQLRLPYLLVGLVLAVPLTTTHRNTPGASS